MRFDPTEFIEVCQCANIHLRREGPFLCWDGSRHWRGNSDLIAVLRQHKDELMPLLPDTSPQADLFDPYQ
ncbi:hypothetical protein QZJ86_11185 [Methylomonas montana]|uniref:hypothetical protein n=1 Tax=Methylomonas montana TaxID=3058963 RepID=UPI002659549D|nr:hypothetical protein [Methylomonas montana]WKJ88589.1 hypothetical protein QZJ86_11185 [Methylomonas montana]